MSEIDPAVSRLYREVSGEAPPAALDAAILAAARQQGARPARPPRPWWTRWAVPASLMATLVLGVSLSLLVEREHPEVMDDTIIRPLPPLPAPATSPVAAPEAATAAVKITPRVEARRSASPGHSITQTPAAAEAHEAKVAPASGPTAADAPAAVLAPLAVPESAPVSAPAPAPVSVPPPAAPAAFPAERQRSAAPRLMREAKDAGVAADRLEAGIAGAAARAESSTRQAATLPPEAWLAEIRRLKREGRADEVAEQLRKFRQAHPHHPLPDDLAH